jgi:hypothetical protein
MIRLPLVFLALLGATSASAQNFTVTGLTLNLTSPAPPTITAAMCTANAPLVFTVGGTINFTTTQANALVAVFAVPLSAGQCPTTNPTGLGTQIAPAVRFTWQSGIAVPIVSTGTTNPLSQADFGSPTVVSLGTSVCGITTAPANPIGLCAYVIDEGTPANLTPTQPGIALTINTTPATMEISLPIAGDAQIKFTAKSNQAENQGFMVCYAEGTPLVPIAQNTIDALNNLVGSGGFCTGNGLLESSFVKGSLAGTSTTPDIQTLSWYGLTNGNTYVFAVYGNVGKVWSSTVLGGATGIQPLEKFSTLELYDGPGGGVSWQCSQSDTPLTLASVATLLLLAIAAFFVSPSRRRKSREFLAKGLFGAAFLLVVSTANADAGQWDLGLKGTFYKPALDKPLTFPVYRCLYSDATIPRLGLDFDFHVFDPFGSIQLGFGVNFAWASGSASNNRPTDGTCASAGGLATASPVGMYLLQMTPRITYVFDAFAEDFPLVPFVQAGFVMNGYYFTYQGDADIKGQTAGRNPLGIRFGQEYTIGLMFLLDVLEPQVAASARATGTYARTYLKAQLTYQNVDDFNRAGYNFSPAVFGKDVPLMVDFALVFEFQ